MLTAFFILALVLTLTVIALIRPNFGITIVASLFWLLFWAYTRDNPLIGMATGGFTDSIIYYGSFFMMVVIFFYYFARRNKQRNLEQNGYQFSSDNQVLNSGSPNRPPRSTGIMDMSPEEYKAYIRNKANNGRKG